MLYTANVIYSLTSRAFPEVKKSVVCAEFPISSKFHFFQWKIYFPKYIFMDKYLKFKGIEYVIHHVKFEI